MQLAKLFLTSSGCRINFSLLRRYKLSATLGVTCFKGIKTVPILEALSTEELKRLHTGTLMARREKLLKCEESLDKSDKDSSYSSPARNIEFKTSDEWQIAYKQLNEELSKREHWPSKGERRECRRSNAK